MRVNKITLILGKRGSGKTTYLKAVIQELQKAHPKRGFLLMDTFDSPDYEFVPVLSLSDFDRWKGTGFYRIFGSNTDEILAAIQAKAANMFICFEDSTKYIKKNLQPDVRRFIIDSKQKNLDLLFTFHGFATVPPEMFRLADKLVIFKTDNPDYRKTEIIAFDQVKAAWEKTMRDKNPYAHNVVNVY